MGDWTLNRFTGTLALTISYLINQIFNYIKGIEEQTHTIPLILIYLDQF